MSLLKTMRSQGYRFIALVPAVLVLLGMGTVVFPLASARAAEGDAELHIGFIGTYSGPSASLGIANKRSLETRAEWLNETGGVKIGDKNYKIIIDSYDDQKDPKLAIEAIQKLIAQNVHYVVGPNTDVSAGAIRPYAEAKNVMYFAYDFPKELYAKPASNAVLGMVADYQSAPSILKWLKHHEKAKNFATLAAKNADGLGQRDAAVAIAKSIGMKIVSAKVMYPTDMTDFTPAFESLMKAKPKPDVIYLAGLSPDQAPLILKAGRAAGFKGRFVTASGLDAKLLRDQAGDAANGLILVGGSSTPDMASPMMREFVARYTKKFGEYNDEASTKVYALEYILEMLKANPKAIDDVKLFKKTMEDFSAVNPFVKDGDKPNMRLRYVGQAHFGQKRQIFVPMVVSEYKNGDYRPLFLDQVE